MTTLPAVRAALPVLTDEILSMTAKLHPDEALARLGPVWAASKPGLAQRALLAARIALMRKAMTVAPVVVGEPEPAPVPEPEPVFVPAPPPKPAPLNKGALTLLNLEDAAKMLMAGGGSDEEDEAEEADVPPETDLPADELRAEVEEEVAEVIAVEAALVEAKAKGKRQKAKAAPAEKAGGVDLAAQFADMAGDAAPAAAPAPAAIDLSAQFAAMGGEDEPAPVVAKKGKAGGMADLSAQFAAMGGEDEPAPAKKAKAGVIDLSAQFAAMDDD